MVSFDSETISTVIAAIAGAGATWLGIKRKISSDVLSVTQNDAQVDVIKFLQDTRQLALDEQEKTNKLYNEVKANNIKLEAEIDSLAEENEHLRSQNKILNDIIVSLQMSLNQTKQILEEQIAINNQLLEKINNP